MLFGLKNAPPAFQRLVDKVLAGLIGNGVYVYIDDILIYTQTPEEHLFILEQVLARLKMAGLKVSLSKSVWMVPEVHYLGYIIGHNMLKMDPEKVKDMLEMKTPPERMKHGKYVPNLRKQIKMFLGAAGFYRRFIRDFASISACLTDLTAENKRQVWGEVHTVAWREIQRRLATAPVLAQPNHERTFMIDTDASNTGLGAVLIQKNQDDNPHPIAYASRKLTLAELVYSTREQEALAIIFGIDKFDHFVRGRNLW